LPVEATAPPTVKRVASNAVIRSAFIVFLLKKVCVLVLAQTQGFSFPLVLVEAGAPAGLIRRRTRDANVVDSWNGEGRHTKS
jgi:hypothetical protein